MPTMGYPLDAYLVVDNNALVSLCEYSCYRFQHMPFSQMVQTVCDEVSTIFNKLRRYAIGEKLFTTDCVQNEFKPEKGVIADYRGFSTSDCDCLKSHIRGEVEPIPVNMKKVDSLRTLPQVPSKLGERLCRLSDEDLSLVILALGIAHKFQQRVYILTNDEDLRSFVSWMKPKPEVRTMCACPNQVEAIHSLVYMDSAHRHCTFPTDYILSFWGYLLMCQSQRNMLHGTTKGEMIMHTYQSVFDAIQASREAKLQHAMKVGKA